MGVRRAMGIVFSEINKKKEGRLFTFGPLIHNRQVLDLLASKGVLPIEDLEGLSKDRLVIRAHGIPPQARQAIRNTNLTIIDATCPKVARVQAIIRYHTNKGYTAVIVGDRDHAEVKGLMGYSKKRAYVIKDTYEVSDLPQLDRVVVVAQTTQNKQEYDKVVEVLKKRFEAVLVFDTICNATRDRQKEVLSFKDEVDAVVVVGGYHSGNTKRLVRVSQQAGLPTFFIETEKELDKKALSEMETIGVTAGASTPNWMIKSVVREIESIRGRKETVFGRMLRRLFKFLVLSNLFTAGGAFFFSCAGLVLSKENFAFTFPFITFLYIFAMHVLNVFLDKGASAYNDPERAAFLKKYRQLLVISGILAVAMALFLSFRIGMISFMAFAGLCLLGITYSIPLVPESIQHKYPYSKIKDIPGSRSLSESLAWVAVIIALPLIKTGPIDWSAAILSGFIVFSMGYVRSALFNVFQVQGDLIVGRETLPITIGEEKTLLLIKSILLVSAFLLCLFALFSLADPFAYFMLLIVFTLFLCVIAYENHWVYPGINLEALVETNFYLAGLFALFRHYVS